MIQNVVSPKVVWISFLSVATRDCEGQPRLCYLYLLLGGKLSSGLAFFPIPLGTACPNQNRFHNVLSFILFSIEVLGSCITKEHSVLRQLTDSSWGSVHSLICVWDFAFLPPNPALLLFPNAAWFVSLQYNFWHQLPGNIIFQMWLSVLVDLNAF